ncbi:MAG: restriction endonuclease subunit S [Nanoarchaeota archaeon]|nr:restriction endonuclease subunit S [Nanoarchaeota archaeon]MBU1321906.1 restriction endonuclease subunit S [Nanoarchaeota archaeon]MBU1598429.1 restriction endonuclease subunit S [Nanoarchaeota archaeon]MBU2441055.1 restriction endonuclease subunit S [Nanoarchaeota archaeon]
MKKYMFDTNCFYKIKSSETDKFNNFQILITPIQEREIQEQKFPDQERKERFLKVCKSIKTQKSLLCSFVPDHPEACVLDSSTLKIDGGKITSKLLEELNTYKKEENNLDDALIAENAIQSDAILVTNEVKLRKIVNKFYPGKAISLDDFKKKMKTKFKQTEIGKIPEDWEVVEVHEIGKVVTGKTPPTKNKNYFGSAYPFIRIPDMGKSVYVEKTEISLSEKGAEYMKKLKLPPKTVMISCLATIGKVGITIRDSFTNQQINSVIPNLTKIYPEWIYYYFKIKTKYLESLGGGGSVYTNISKSKFERAKITLPKLEEQKNIIKILSDLDAKIELNTQMNQTLESIGQAIFKHWFVDFEFPNEQGKPYKSSGGEMVNSELGKIPKGWRVGKFDGLGKIQPGFAFKSKDFVEDGIKLVKIRNIQNSEINLTCESYLPKNIFDSMDNKFHLKSGDVLIAMTGAKIGKIGIIPKNKEIMLLNQRVGKVISDNKYLIYLFLKSKMIQSLITGTSSASSAQANVSNTDIENIEIILPNQETLSKFNQIIDSIYEKLVQNLGENIILSKIRDALLPKLMSGQIRVPVEVKND